MSVGSTGGRARAQVGGVKASGTGREFGPEGLAAYQQLKSVYLG